MPTSSNPLSSSENILSQAIAHHRAGHLKLAKQLYLSILRTDPYHPDTNHNLGILFYQSSQYSTAIPYFESALSAAEVKEQYVLSYISTLLKQYRVQEATTILRQVMQGNVASAAMLALRDQADAMRDNQNTVPEPLSHDEMISLASMFQASEHAEVEIAARSLVERYPDSGFTWKVLGAALQMQGKDALQALNKAVQLRPQDAEALTNLAVFQRELQLWEDAIKNCRLALAINAKCVPALTNLALACHRTGLLDEALGQFHRALEIEPNLSTAHNDLANLLQDLGKPEEAITHYRRALAIDPLHAETYYNLSLSLYDLMRFQEAESRARDALVLNPRLGKAMVLLAKCLASRGRFDDAEALCEQASSFNPDLHEAWAEITNLRKMTVGDSAWFAGATRALARSSTPQNETILCFAIGKYFDDIKDFDSAFPYFHRANEVAKKIGNKYEPERRSELVDHLIQNFGRDWRASMHGVSAESRRPVFVVGMPRSGTTLVEQILASHPEVYGAGELTFWVDALGHYDAQELLKQSGNRILEDLAQRYLQFTEHLDGKALRTIDKMPGNFLLLGFIHTALPNARIIHLQRNPIDTCLSIYFQNFKSMHSYANDLDDVAHFYGEYTRIMNHWRSVLPEGVLLDLPYEELIQDQETWIRTILRFIDLPWDPQCLDFHRNDRAVHTVSNWQVRQKINRKSVDRWRNYEKFVAPLLHLLPSGAHRSVSRS